MRSGKTLQSRPVGWRRPLDWHSGAGREAASRPDRVDVIVPVYGAAADLARCLRSVAAHTDLTRHRVLLIIDGPQDQAVETLVAGFDATIIRNAVRAGFAESVNRGISESRGDVVLLNSDTVVTSGWLEKMIDAAYSSGDVGTVTPLSNNATLCSVPRPFVENLLPTGYEVDSFAALVERVSVREYPRLPTAVGFCMYIRRALIDDIGVFDAKTFAGGYGEENDFSMRALARGWVHVADDATFVFHAGSRSFGRERAGRQRRARATLRRRHPRYDATIAEFMKCDPLAGVRARIAHALVPRRTREKRRIVHVVHGWPPFQHAGTELYAYWLVERQRNENHVAVYTRSADASRADGEAIELFDRGVRVRLIVNNFTSRNPLRRNAIRDAALERDFERFLREERPHLVHVHHLAGHTFSLAGVARRAGVPVVMQLQDWWSLCARVNLLDRDGRRCSGPEVAKCAACVTLTRVTPGANRVMHAMRRSAAGRALRAADAFIAGSNAIHNDYRSVVPDETPFHVIPYGIAMAPARAPRTLPAPLRFGYVGSIAPHKGVHVAAEAIDGLAATLHVWGDDSAFPSYAESVRRIGNVVFKGRFAEEEKDRVFESIDILLVPSIGLESFGLAAREAMARGVPVIATSGGALDEMFAADTCGEFVPPGDAGALRAILQRVIDDPAIVQRWCAALPTPKSADVHAEEIERVYDSVV